jgi:integrase
MHSSALKQAVKWRLASSNPVSFAELPRRNRDEMKALLPDEAARFLAAADEDPHGVMFKLALTTGMRPEE